MSMLAAECQVEVSHKDMNRYTIICASFPIAVNARVKGFSLRRITTADGLASIVGSSSRDRNLLELESRTYTKPGIQRTTEWIVAQLELTLL